MKARRAFTRLEFAALILGGMLIIGLLVFIFLSQNLRQQQLNDMVARDQVRLHLEEQILSRAALEHSVIQSTDATAKACVFGTETCADYMSGCCWSHKEGTSLGLAFRTLELEPNEQGQLPRDDEDQPSLTGTPDLPSCLSRSAEIVALDSHECFAHTTTSVRFMCPGLTKSCLRAEAAVIYLRIEFQSMMLDAPLSSDGERARTIYEREFSVTL
jgi:hypothetical protein